MADELLQDVFVFLVGGLSPNRDERMHSECQLSSLAASDGGHLAALTTIASHPQTPVEVAQLALVLVKQQGCHPQVWERAGETQRLVRERLLSLLGHSVPRIRVAAAFALAAIAEHAQWPSLPHELSQRLRSSDSALCHGVLRCLMLVVGDLDEQQLSLAFQKDGIVAELTRLVSAPALEGLGSSAHDHLRRRALCVISVVVDEVAMALDQSESGPAYAQHACGEWISLYTAHAHALGSGQGAVTGEAHGTAIAFARLLGSLVTNFPKLPLLHQPNVALTVLSAAWSVLIRASRVVQQAQGEMQAGGGEGCVDSDGSEVGWEALLLSSLELFTLLPDPEAFKPLVRNALDMLLPELLRLMRVTRVQAADWQQDLAEYVESEGEDSLGFSVRVAATELAVDLLRRFGSRALVAMLSAARAQLSAASAQRKQEQEAQRQQEPGSRDGWWPQAECALRAIQLCVRHSALSAEEVAQRTGFELRAFLRSELPLAAAHTAPLFVRARAIALAGSSAQRMLSSEREGWLALALDALRIDGAHAARVGPVHVCAARTVSELCEVMAEAGELSSAQISSALLGLAGLLRCGQVAGDVLCLFVEAVALVLAEARGPTLSTLASAETVDPLAAALCECLASNPECQLLWAAVTEALELLMLAGPRAHSIVAARLLPTMQRHIRSAQARTAGGHPESEASLPLRLFSLLLRTAPSAPAPLAAGESSRGAAWEELRLCALEVAPFALHELTNTLRAAAALPGAEAEAQFEAIERLRACASCLGALVSTGLLPAEGESQALEVARYALEPNLPLKIAAAIQPLACAQLLTAVAAAGAGGQPGARADACVRELATLLSARLLCCSDSALSQQLWHTLARLAVALVQRKRKLEGASALVPDGQPRAPESEGAASLDESGVWLLLTGAGEGLCTLLGSLLPAHAQQPPGGGEQQQPPGAGEPQPPNHSLAQLLFRWSASVRVFAGAQRRKLSTLVLLGALLAMHESLATRVPVPTELSSSSSGAVRTRARARSEAALALQNGGAPSVRSVPLSVRLFEVVLAVLREELDLQASDALDAQRADDDEGESGDSEAEALGDADGSTGGGARQPERQSLGPRGQSRRDSDMGEAQTLAHLAQVHSMDAALDMLGDNDDVAETHGESELQLSRIELGPFLASFVRSFAQSSPHQLQSCLDQMDEPARATVQRILTSR